MKRLYFSLAAVSALAIASATAASAGSMNLCTGGEKGNYYWSGNVIKQQAQGLLDVNVLKTQGSIENLKKLASGECDAAIVQGDALRVFKEENPSAAISVEQLATLYREYAHLICNKSLGITSITKMPQSTKVLVGGLGSGSYVTWKSLGIADEYYKKMPTGTETGSVALLKLKAGTDAQCMMFVTGLNSAVIKEVAKNSEDKLTLVEVDDGDFNDEVDEKGNRIYEFAKFGGQYPGLDGGYDNWDTITIAASFVVNTEWVNAHQDDFNTLAEALVAAQSSITQHVTPVE
jgi:TRAP-type uncharacterized transport system substrate-binding protein